MLCPVCGRTAVEISPNLHRCSAGHNWRIMDDLRTCPKCGERASKYSHSIADSPYDKCYNCGNEFSSYLIPRNEWPRTWIGG